MSQTERRAEILTQVHPMLLRYGEKDVDNFRVELRSGAAPNLFPRMADGKCFPIGAVADHGVEGVGDRAYSCAERNLFTL